MLPSFAWGACPRLEDVRKEIDVARYRQQFAGDDPNNQEYSTGPSKA